MIEFNPQSSEIKIIIPLSDLNDLTQYQRGIMGILSKIEIDAHDTMLMENLKAVYDLLSHLIPDRDFLFAHRELIIAEKLPRRRL